MLISLATKGLLVLQLLSMNWDKFQTGDKIAVAVVGSGLTWGAALF